MFKKFTAAVVLGAIVGAVAYKIKKEYDDRKMLEEELEMLSANESCGCQCHGDCDCSCDEECTCECHEECTCECHEECKCEKEESIVDEIKEEVQEVVEEAKEIVYEVIEEVQEVVEEKIEDVKEVIEEKIEENPAVSETVEKKTAFLEESFQENEITADLNEQYKKELDENSDEIIHKLSSENDELKEERPIQHTIDFKSLDDLEAYKKIVIEKGYVATKGENQYQLSVLHVAPINKSELLVNVYYLANQAVKHNATYRGWQSRKVL